MAALSAGHYFSNVHNTPVYQHDLHVLPGARIRDYHAYSSLSLQNLYNGAFINRDELFPDQRTLLDPEAIIKTFERYSHQFILSHTAKCFSEIPMGCTAHQVYDPTMLLCTGEINRFTYVKPTMAKEADVNVMAAKNTLLTIEKYNDRTALRAAFSVTTSLVELLNELKGVKDKDALVAKMSNTFQKCFNAVIKETIDSLYRGSVARFVKYVKDISPIHGMIKGLKIGYAKKQALRDVHGLVNCTLNSVGNAMKNDTFSLTGSYALNNLAEIINDSKDLFDQFGKNIPITDILNLDQLEGGWYSANSIDKLKDTIARIKLNVSEETKDMIESLYRDLQENVPVIGIGDVSHVCIVGKMVYDSLMNQLHKVNVIIDNRRSLVVQNAASSLVVDYSGVAPRQDGQMEDLPKDPKKLHFGLEKGPHDLATGKLSTTLSKEQGFSVIKCKGFPHERKWVLIDNNIYTMTHDTQEEGLDVTRGVLGISRSGFAGIMPVHDKMYIPYRVIWRKHDNATEEVSFRQLLTDFLTSPTMFNYFAQSAVFNGALPNVEEEDNEICTDLAVQHKLGAAEIHTDRQMLFRQDILADFDTASLRWKTLAETPFSNVLKNNRINNVTYTGERINANLDRTTYDDSISASLLWDEVSPFTQLKYTLANRKLGSDLPYRKKNAKDLAKRVYPKLMAANIPESLRPVCVPIAAGYKFFEKFVGEFLEKYDETGNPVIPTANRTKIQSLETWARSLAGTDPFSQDVYLLQLGEAMINSTNSAKTLHGYFRDYTSEAITYLVGAVQLYQKNKTMVMEHNLELMRAVSKISSYPPIFKELQRTNKLIINTANELVAHCQNIVNFVETITNKLYNAVVEIHTKSNIPTSFNGHRQTEPTSLDRDGADLMAGLMKAGRAFSKLTDPYVPTTFPRGVIGSNMMSAALRDHGRNIKVFCVGSFDCPADGDVTYCDHVTPKNNFTQPNEYRVSNDALDSARPTKYHKKLQVTDPQCVFANLAYKDIISYKVFEECTSVLCGDRVVAGRNAKMLNRNNLSPRDNPTRKDNPSFTKDEGLHQEYINLQLKPLIGTDMFKALLQRFGTTIDPITIRNNLYTNFTEGSESVSPSVSGGATDESRHSGDMGELQEGEQDEEEDPDQASLHKKMLQWRKLWECVPSRDTRLNPGDGVFTVRAAVAPSLQFEDHLTMGEAYMMEHSCCINAVPVKNVDFYTILSDEEIARFPDIFSKHGYMQMISLNRHCCFGLVLERNTNAFKRFMYRPYVSSDKSSHYSPDYLMHSDARTTYREEAANATYNLSNTPDLTPVKKLYSVISQHLYLTPEAQITMSHLIDHPGVHGLVFTLKDRIQTEHAFIQLPMSSVVKQMDLRFDTSNEADTTTCSITDRIAYNEIKPGNTAIAVPNAAYGEFLTDCGYHPYPYNDPEVLSKNRIPEHTKAHYLKLATAFYGTNGAPNRSSSTGFPYNNGLGGLEKYNNTRFFQQNSASGFPFSGAGIGGASPSVVELYPIPINVKTERVQTGFDIRNPGKTHSFTEISEKVTRQQFFSCAKSGTSNPWTTNAGSVAFQLLQDHPSLMESDKYSFMTPCGKMLYNPVIQSICFGASDLMKYMGSLNSMKRTWGDVNSPTPGRFGGGSGGAGGNREGGSRMRMRQAFKPDLESGVSRSHVNSMSMSVSDKTVNHLEYQHGSRLFLTMTTAHQLVEQSVANFSNWSKFYKHKSGDYLCCGEWAEVFNDIQRKVPPLM